jgi:hypothetical protein
MFQTKKISSRKFTLLGLLGFFLLSHSIQPTHAQSPILLNNLSYFEKPGTSWNLSGDVNLDPSNKGQLSIKPGCCILVNKVSKQDRGTDLISTLEHGDADIEFDYMMAAGSNSGVYLQGRYEIQLLDSWAVLKPSSADNGGVYERWDDKRGSGKEGYEGYAPRNNLSMAPGLWQHLKISFQAPRFNSNHVKIANAKLLKVELNGVLIHDNLELLGPTRGSLGTEVSSGPLRLQGDHGDIAFKNLKVLNYTIAPPIFSSIKYFGYTPKPKEEFDFVNRAPIVKDSSLVLTSNLDEKLFKNLVVQSTGILHIKTAGTYTFNVNMMNAAGAFKINQKIVTPFKSGNSSGKIELSIGDHSFELFYVKTNDWSKPTFSVSVMADGMREYSISDPEADMTDLVDPIYISGNPVNVVRSFMEIPNLPIITHAINVSSVNAIHYTYDMNKGAVAQIWKGDFLDATAMWHDRGNGTSKPMGAIKYFDDAYILNVLDSSNQAWNNDVSGTQFTPKGYMLDQDDLPTFKYLIYGTKVNDKIRVLADGKMVQREMTIDKPISNLYIRLAKAKLIENMGNNSFLIGDKSYYLNVEANERVFIREINGMKELLVPIQHKLTWSIIF